MKERYTIECIKVNGSLIDTEVIEFSSEKERDSAFELIARACGKDGKRAFTGYGQCSANGFIFARMTMLEDK